MLYDAHNHLQDARLAPHLGSVLRDLESIGLRAAVVNGTEEADWPAVAAWAQDHHWVVPSFGLHPWHIAGRSVGWRERLADCLDAFLSNARPVAVGEIGLDRWKKPFDLTDQEAVLVAQLEVAADRRLPVTIHCLKAWEALEAVLRRGPLPARGFLLHAYGGPPELVPRLAQLGGYFSFNAGFPGSSRATRQQAFKAVPPDRLLVETDAPSMPPAPGSTRFSLPPAADGDRINHPASLVDGYAALASCLGMEREALGTLVRENFRRFFGVDL